MRVRPYYLYQCDLVEGSGHFRTPVGKGLEIIEGLRGHTSRLRGADLRRRRARRRRQDPGDAELPHLVLGPQDRAPQLRGLHHHLRGAARVQAARQGELRVVPAPAPGGRPGRRPRAAPGRADVDRAGRASSRSTSAATTEAHRLKDPAKWVPYGVGAIEGQVVGSRAAGARGRGRAATNVRRVAGLRSRRGAAPAPRAHRPRPRTTSCSDAERPACGPTAIRLQFDEPRAVKRGRGQSMRRRGADKGIA